MGSVDPPPSSKGNSPGPFVVSSVAIIGAGPCGLAAAKYLLSQSKSSPSRSFSKITVFEKQAQVGGVWLYSAEPSDTQHIPQTSATCPPDPPLSRRDGDGSPVFPSAMYEDLHTNIPHTLMRYGDVPFPAGAHIFPRRDVVQTYLEDYAREVRDLIRLSTEVAEVRLRVIDGPEASGREQWDVTSRDLVSGRETTETYDALVVASGHYSVTYVPEVSGIRDFDAAHPGVLSHSKRYRTPGPFADKRVLVVGNSASGLDIASQIGGVCAQPLYVSVLSPTPDDVREHVGGFEEVGEIERLLIAERGVRLKDGREIHGLDAVLFATGYSFTYPFLESVPFDPPLVTDGRKVQGLYKHLIHIQHPTLAFSGLPIKVIPFPLAESQAAVFSRVWANELALPSRAEMEAWERKEAEERGTKYHVFPKGGDGEYINGVHDWIAREAKGKGGKEPPRWDAKSLWQRGIYAQAKMEFEKTGKKATSLEELGFVYEPEKSGEKVREASRRDPDLNVAA